VFTDLVFALLQNIQGLFLDKIPDGVGLSCFDCEASEEMEHKWVALLADVLLKPVYIDNPHDASYVMYLMWEDLHVIIEVGRTCQHLRRGLEACMEYQAVKLAFFEAAQMEAPFWVTPWEHVVYHTYENWRQFKKLHAPTAGFTANHQLFSKSLEQLTLLELQELRDTLRKFF
jgi:hypothetical protein